MPVTYQREFFLHAMPELPALFIAEWDEVNSAGKDEKQLAVDWDKYVQLEMQGLLTMTTARDEGKLVGYALNIICTPGHFANNLFCFIDAFWIKPEYRKDDIDKAFVEFNDNHLKEQKVEFIEAGVNPSLWLYRLMKGLQYERTKCILTKKL